MRKPIQILCFGLLAVCFTGCESTRWNWLKRDPDKDIARPGPNPTVNVLVDYLNTNAKRVNSIKVSDVDVDASSGFQTINVRGVLFAERPLNFRMKVGLLGKEKVDIGSNRNEFWFWAAENKDRYQYFCSYKDLNAGRVAVMPLPVQPEWIMETLGLGPYGPAEKYQLESEGANQIRLVERATSPLRKPIKKVIVMNRKEMRPPQPQVTSFHLIDETTSQEICSAHISSVQVVGGAMLPHRMELRVPGQQMKLALKLDNVVVNGQIAATAFERPEMAGVQPFNLATGQVEAWGPRRAGGFP